MRRLAIGSVPLSDRTPRIVAAGGETELDALAGADGADLVESGLVRSIVRYGDRHRCGHVASGGTGTSDGDRVDATMAATRAFGAEL
jgi:hypothetical protein